MWLRKSDLECNGAYPGTVTRLKKARPHPVILSLAIDLDAEGSGEICQTIDQLTYQTL